MIVSKVFSFCVRVTIALLIVAYFSMNSFAEEKIDRPDMAEWEMKFAKDPKITYETGKQYLANRDCKKALAWFKLSYDLGNPEGAFGIGWAYEDCLREFDKALKWYKKAYDEGFREAALTMGILYKNKLNDYTNALRWYEIANEHNNKDAAYAIGLLYKTKLKDYDNAEKWYKIGAKNGGYDSVKGLAILYLDIRKDNVVSAAYYLGLIGHGYTKKSTFDFFRNDLNMTDSDIKKAYDLHQTLDLPYHYTGGID